MLRADPAANAQWSLRPEDGAIELMQGLRTRWNPRHKILAVELHYSADPDKRTVEWEESERAGNRDVNWDREYELGWRVSRGIPVFKGVFNAETHVGKNLPYDEGRGLIVGWDFGLDPCAVFAQLSENGLLNVIGECYAPTKMPIENMLPYYFAYVSERFGLPRKPWIHVADPSAWNTGTTSKASQRDILNQAGIFPIKGPVAISARLGNVAWWLNQGRSGKPLIQFDAVHAAEIIEGMRSGYIYEQRKAGSTDVKPVPAKNEWSHGADCLQYICSHARILASGYAAQKRITRAIGSSQPQTLMRRRGRQD